MTFLMAAHLEAGVRFGAARAFSASKAMSASASASLSVLELSSTSRDLGGTRGFNVTSPFKVDICQGTCPCFETSTRDELSSKALSGKSLEGVDTLADSREITGEPLEKGENTSPVSHPETLPRGSTVQMSTHVAIR